MCGETPCHLSEMRSQAPTRARSHLRAPPVAGARGHVWRSARALCGCVLFCPTAVEPGFLGGALCGHPDVAGGLGRTACHGGCAAGYSTHWWRVGHGAVLAVACYKAASWLARRVATLAGCACTNRKARCACDVWTSSPPLTSASAHGCLTPLHAYRYLTPLRVQVVSLVQNGGRPEIPAPAAVPGGAFAGARVCLG